METVVRMGELAVSRATEDVLVTIGLGSCIGLAIVDAPRSIGGLAHIMLPGSTGATREGAGPATFADQAVPALMERLTALGARPRELSAFLVGGAQMFAFGGSAGLDVGRRNEDATRAALADAGISVRAAATSGNKGRTVRVHVGAASVTFKEAGGKEVVLS